MIQKRIITSFESTIIKGIITIRKRKKGKKGKVVRGD